MENIDFATLFQGFGTMMESGWLLSSARVFLIALGLLLIYLGWKGVLEPMVMIPMGLGMVAINCGTLFMPDGTLGNLFLDPMLSDTDDLMNTMQIDFLQPVYTLTFSNGLIACFVFMGIGTLLDVGFLLQKPFASIFLARMQHLDIHFTDIRPGFVATDLLKSGKYPMLMKADRVAQHIIKALREKRRVVVIDGRYRVLVFFWRMIPRWLWERLPITN